MHSFPLLLSSSLFALTQAHSVILGAQGLDTSPNSIGFQVDPEIARNCITINPCQQDATIIRDAEITANIVNQCGRTEISGNIDVGENTENAISANQVTQVEAGGELTVTIHQVNADGAGPYVCDLDESSNTNTNIQNLTVTNNVPGTNGLSQVKTQAFNITVKMPDDLNCFGASTGNICTVRCRNNALAGPFGGCFAVQQADTDKKTNTPQSIKTTQTLKGINDQILQNQKDFEDSVKANENASSDEAAQNKAAVDALLGATVVTSAFATETPSVALGRPPVATPDPNQGNDGKAGENNGGNNNNNNGGNDNNNDNNQDNNNDNQNGGNNGNNGNNGGDGGDNNGGNNDNNQGSDNNNGGDNKQGGGNGGQGGNGGNRGGQGGNPFGGNGGFPFGGGNGQKKAKRGFSMRRWAQRA